MFTIEHGFDASVVTLVDEGEKPLREDVTVTIFDDMINLSQFDERRGETVTITLSLSQARDMGAALDLPEGVYRLRPKT